MRSMPFHVASQPGTDFTGACAQNAGLTADIVLARSLQRAGGESLAILKSIAITSVQNLAWELWLMGNSGGASGTIASENFYGRWTFNAADAVQLAGAGLYHYYIDGLDVSYVDLDRVGKVHLLLINRSAVAKIAAAPGAVRVRIGLESATGM